jgi:hypothetical protein
VVALIVTRAAIPVGDGLAVGLAAAWASSPRAARREIGDAVALIKRTSDGIES